MVLKHKIKVLSKELRDDLWPLVEEEVGRIRSCKSTPQRLKHRLVKMRYNVAKRRIAVEVERRRIEEWSDGELRRLAVQQIQQLDATMLLTLDAGGLESLGLGSSGGSGGGGFGAMLGGL